MRSAGFRNSRFKISDCGIWDPPRLSRSGRSEGSFSSYSSNASRFGVGLARERESVAASTKDHQYRGPRGYDPVQSRPQTATKHTKSPPRKPVPTSHTQALGSQHDEMQQQSSPPTQGQQLQQSVLKKKNKPPPDVEAVRVQASDLRLDVDLGDPIDFSRFYD